MTADLRKVLFWEHNVSTGKTRIFVYITDTRMLYCYAGGLTQTVKAVPDNEINRMAYLWPSLPSAN